MNIRSLSIFIAGLMLAAMLMSGAASATDLDNNLPSEPAGDFALRGSVESGSAGLPGYEVVLFVKYAGSTEPLQTLGTAMTDASGEFEISYQLPDGPLNQQQPILFVKAEKDRSMLVSAIGMAPVSGDIIVNERTTVAAGFAFAQFIDEESVSGNEYGMINAVHMAGNLANPETGAVGEVLGSSPNGPDTSTLQTFNSLANIVASCVDSWSGCYVLFNATTPPGKSAPGNVLEAVANIAKFSWLNTDLLFLLSLDMQIYSPARLVPPDAWALFLRFTGTDTSKQTSDDLMNGPGAFAIDEKGYLWVNDNYIPKAADEIACAGVRLLKFYPWGENFPGSPYFGGGLEGAGFGITLAPNGHVWVGNFGFEAPDCATPGNPYGVPATNNSVSEFRPDGMPVSPDVTGYVDGDISWPQSTVADKNGSIWLANCGSDSVTLYPGGLPDKAYNIVDIGLEKPFGLAIGDGGNAWVVGNKSNSLAILGPAGDLVKAVSGTATSVQQLTHPMGIAADSQGNIWVANSDVVDAPCNPPAKNFGEAENPSIALLTPNGEFHPNSPFSGGGVLIPWGIAVDGNDTVWVANFGVNPNYDDPDNIGERGVPPRVSQFCGMDPSKCPPGKQQTGQPISPANGYTSDALLRNTGIAIDPSGNVWLANNWKEIPPQWNPGGNSIAVMVGAAAPLKTPLIGLPEPFNH